MNNRPGSRLIGIFDKVDLPEFELYDLDCKIDTGAYTSAIHCHRVCVIETPHRRPVLSFHLLDPAHPQYNDHEYQATHFYEKKVTSSSGHSDYRFVIQTKIILFGELFDIEFTLADREQMRYPILLGRKFLKKYGFLVDVRKKNLSFFQKKQA
jgi:hypothetical protein